MVGHLEALYNALLKGGRNVQKRPLGPDAITFHCGDSQYDEALRHVLEAFPGANLTQNGALLGYCEVFGDTAFSNIPITPDSSESHITFCPEMWSSSKSLHPNDYKGYITENLYMMLNWPATFLHELLHWAFHVNMADHPIVLKDGATEPAYGDSACYYLANKMGPEGKQKSLTHVEAYSIFLTMVNLPRAYIDMGFYEKWEGDTSHEAVH